MFILKFPYLTKNFSNQLNLSTRHLCSRTLNSHIETLILKHTAISSNHLTPELKLRLITPECELWNCKSSESEFPNDPFWGIYWPGGQALGRYIFDNVPLFHQKNVLDIGSGSGACALAAVKVGAKVVLANDIDPVSMTAIQINAKLNGVQVYKCDYDLIGKDIDLLAIQTDNGSLLLEWNVILVGDLFYNSEFSGDPGRHALKELDSVKDSASIVKVAEYSLSSAEHNGFSSSSVFKVGLDSKKFSMNMKENKGTRQAS